MRDEQLLAEGVDDFPTLSAWVAAAPATPRVGGGDGGSGSADEPPPLVSLRRNLSEARLAAQRGEFAEIEVDADGARRELSVRVLEAQRAVGCCAPHGGNDGGGGGDEADRGGRAPLRRWRSASAG